MAETVGWEVASFFEDLARAVDAEPDLEGKVATGLAVGRRSITEHGLLQRLLRTEPEAVLGELSATTALVREGITGYIGTELARARRAGVVRADCDVDEAADHLARLFLSYMASPGRWDLDDPDQVALLVRTQFLAGVLAPS
jgi:hypothetical protein